MLLKEKIQELQLVFWTLKDEQCLEALKTVTFEKDRVFRGEIYYPVDVIRIQGDEETATRFHKIFRKLLGMPTELKKYYTIQSSTKGKVIEKKYKGVSWTKFGSKPVEYARILVIDF